MDQWKKLRNALLKSMLSRYAGYAFGVISLMLLARAFTPELFGVLALVQSMFLFFQLIAEAGLGPAVINLEKLENDDRDGLFGLMLLFGGGLMLVVLLASSYLPLFFQIDSLDKVVVIVAPSLLFFAASVLPSALLQREQAFYKLANASVVAEIVSTLTVLFAVCWLEPLYALSLKMPIHAFAVYIMLFSFSKETEFGQPKVGCKFSAIKPILSFSSYQFGFNFINYFSRNLDTILVGKYLGASSLGVYDKAYQLMRYPLILLTFAMTPAVQPVIKQFNQNTEEVEQLHRYFLLRLSMVGALAGLLLFFLADWIVVFILGDQWAQVIPIFKILSIAIPVQVVLASTGSFFQALNRADLLFYSGCLSACVMILAIIWGVAQQNLTLLSWALVAAFHINFIQAYFIMYRLIFSKNLLKFFLSQTSVFLSTALMIYSYVNF